MTFTISTGEVAVADRPDYLHEAVAAVWPPMRFRSEHDYQGVLCASGLGSLQVAALNLTPITVLPTARDIEEADPDLVKMLLVIDGGSAVVEQRGQQVELAAGDFVFYDIRRPYRIRCRGQQGRSVRLLTFMFPPSLLPLTPTWRRRLNVVRVSVTTGVGEVTYQFLLQLARNIEHYSPAEAARLSTAALEVLATRLAHELEVPGHDRPGASRQALLTAVQAFIGRHLADPELSPNRIAAAHHMSLRSLHQLFHDQGLTVAGWIRQRRLEGCRRELADPALAQRPVAAVAARWGFADASAFSRAFRSAHGMPPGEFRMSARNVNTSAR